MDMTLLGCGLTVTAITGLYSNIIVVYKFSRSPRMRKRHFFTLNLSVMGALSSVAYSLPCYSLFFGEDIVENACEFEAFAVSILAIGMMLQLMFVSVERCAVVVRPFMERKIRVAHKLNATGFVYLLSLAISCPPLFGWSRFTKVHGMWYCSFDYASTDFNTRSYMIMLLIVGYVLPLLIIMCAYGLIFLALRRQDKSDIRRNSTARRPKRQRTKPIDMNSGSGPQRRQLRIAILMLMVIAAFTICWTPFAAATVIWPFFTDQTPPFALLTLAAICGKSSVVINPIICGCNAASFRATVRRLKNTGSAHFSSSFDFINHRKLPSAYGSRLRLQFSTPLMGENIGNVYYQSRKQKKYRSINSLTVSSIDN